MRALILGLSVLAIVASTNAARAGLSKAPREVASIDTSAVPDAKSDTRSEYRDHRRSRGHARHRRGIGGPIGAIGGAIGGLFHR
jgi:hypothetical protein